MQKTSQKQDLNNAFIAILMLCIAIVGANSLSLSPIAPRIAALLDTTVTSVMVAAAAYGLGTALGALFFAPHIDRIGARQALLWALVILALALVLSTFSPTVEILICAQSVAGLAAGVALPSVYALAIWIAPPGQENTVLGRVLVGWTVSLVAGVSFSALIADVIHWRAVYGLLALLGALAWWVVKAKVPGDRRNPAIDTAAPSLWRALQIVDVVPLLVVCFAYMTAFYGTYAYVGDHVHTVLGKPLKASGLITLSYGVGFGAAAWGDGLIDRQGSRRMMPLSLLAIGVVYLLMGLFSSGFGALVALTFIWGVANHFGLNVIVAALAAVDLRQRGTILGLNSAVTYLSMTFGTLVFAVPYTRWGFASLPLLSGGFAVAAAVFAARRLPPPKPGLWAQRN